MSRICYILCKVWLSLLELALDIGNAKKIIRLMVGGKIMVSNKIEEEH